MPERSATDWYLVLVVAFIVAAAGAAAFYLLAFTSVSPDWFEAIALTGFGALLGLLVPKSAPVAVPVAAVADVVLAAQKAQQIAEAQALVAHPGVDTPQQV